MITTSYANLGEFKQLIAECDRVLRIRQQRMVEAIEQKRYSLAMYWWYEVEDAMRRRNRYIEDRNTLLKQQ